MSREGVRQSASPRRPLSLPCWRRLWRHRSCRRQGINGSGRPRKRCTRGGSEVVSRPRQGSRDGQSIDRRDVRCRVRACSIRARGQMQEHARVPPPDRLHDQRCEAGCVWTRCGFPSDQAATGAISQMCLLVLQGPCARCRAKGRPPGVGPDWLWRRFLSRFAEPSAGDQCTITGRELTDAGRCVPVQAL